MNLSSFQSRCSPDAALLRKLVLARTNFSSGQAPWFSFVSPSQCPVPHVFTTGLALPSIAERGRTSSPDGLGLLRALSLRLPNTVSPPVQPRSVVASSPKNKLQLSKSSTGSDGRVYIDKVKESDILCGRGGKSNHNPGNKRFRQVVSEMKATYRSTEAKNSKTSLSRSIVDHVCESGARFVKKDGATGRYYVLSKAEAQKKTSQALRETKTPKWINDGHWSLQAINVGWQLPLDLLNVKHYVWDASKTNRFLILSWITGSIMSTKLWLKPMKTSWKWLLIS